MYRQKEPATLIRIVGQPPLQATVFEMERLRCNGCGEVFTAERTAVGGPGKVRCHRRGDDRAVEVWYGNALQPDGAAGEDNWGFRFPAATQWELMEAAAKLLRPVLDEFIRQAAQGSVMHNDDTGMRILQMARSTDDGRTGTFTSGIVSIWREWKIALYFTGWKHAGENLADVLKQRAPELAPPIQMCDALSRNTPKLTGSKSCWPTASRTEGGSLRKSRRAFPMNAGMCWSRWARYTASMPKRRIAA